MLRRLLIAVLPLGAAVACGGGAATGAHVATTTAPVVTTSAPPPTPDPTPRTTASPTPRTTATSVAATTPPFRSSVGAVTAADLPASYRPGCPTPPAQLRMLSLSYVDFSGRSQTGQLVVNADQAGRVVAIFADLYVHRFPIRRMTPVDAYGGSDDRSLAADNTAGFNCRAAVSSGPNSWSMHAYGEAIDVDPVENPYVESDGTVDPPNGRAYVDRGDARPGMAERGGELVTAFARQGWVWGVTFGDYQHFSTNGR